MSGLTVGYINSKLVAESVTNKTKQLILDFLNKASSPLAIAGSEPTEGPVVDEPTEGNGDQIRDYDIGVDVAEKLIAKRDLLGAFTNLTQLSAIPFFGMDKFNDLLYSFATTVYDVNYIKFNANDGSMANEALNIRKNFSTAAPSPEWQTGVSVNYQDSPAAYAIKESTGNPLCIKTKFKANNVTAAYIRAIGGGYLGNVKEKCILFNAVGDSGEETFELQNTTFHNYGVNAYNISWQWQWRLKATDPWKTFRTTKHRLFVILQTPTLPWVQTPGSTSLPWTDALEISCNWAAGAKNTIDAGSLIAKKYNECGKVSYDTIQGATFYGSVSYNLTQMINRLNGGAGLGGKVNCTDSANTVSTFANLLGCDLWQSRMTSGFKLNEMIAIGYANWAVPFAGYFSYHEVAWTGGCTTNDKVYDGCLKVDGDASPTLAPHTPLLPVNILFGDCSTMNYRLRLCPPTPDGCAQCVPQPATTRKRRPII